VREERQRVAHADLDPAIEEHRQAELLHEPVNSRRKAMASAGTNGRSAGRRG
jgi:hypothetical protein